MHKSAKCAKGANWKLSICHLSEIPTGSLRRQFIPFWNTQGNFSPRLAECQARLFYVNILRSQNAILKNGHAQHP